MGLHIADVEVNSLLSNLAALEKTTKTEALRRLLRRELQNRQTYERRKRFAEVATRIAEEARAQQLQPVTKDDFDAGWEL